MNGVLIYILIELNRTATLTLNLLAVTRDPSSSYTGPLLWESVRAALFWCVHHLAVLQFVVLVEACTHKCALFQLVMRRHVVCGTLQSVMGQGID